MTTVIPHAVILTPPMILFTSRLLSQLLSLPSPHRRLRHFTRHWHSSLSSPMRYTAPSDACDEIITCIATPPTATTAATASPPSSNPDNDDPDDDGGGHLELIYNRRYQPLHDGSVTVDR